ncbi:hypothetical protein [Rhodoplanes sp. Z2-YC6860]|uniref:hypothetical protein n=1 Tax=Rhodoplanes sp. Z2-YC6860 TaxID=674703 RepID=UPI0012ED5157|nr:hypothetical protein [Rhodoplanes sp. Z2-YC6860]
MYVLGRKSIARSAGVGRFAPGLSTSSYWPSPSRSKACVQSNRAGGMPGVSELLDRFRSSASTVICAVTPSRSRLTSPVITTLPIFSAVQLRPSLAGVALFNVASASLPETVMCARSSTCTPNPAAVRASVMRTPLLSSCPLPAPSTSATTLRLSSANSAVPAMRTSPIVRITLLIVTSLLVLGSKSGS